MMCTKTAFFALSLVVLINNLAFMIPYTGCPTTYQTRHFFNNFKTNEDIVMRFEQEYVPCVRNEEECVRRAPSCCDTEQRFTSQPACILPDAPLCLSLCHLAEGAYTIRLLFVSVNVMREFTQDSWKMYRYTLEERVYCTCTRTGKGRSKIWRAGFNPVWTQIMTTSSTCYDVVTLLTQRTCSCSNFVAIPSLVLELLKKCRVR